MRVPLHVLFAGFLVCSLVPAGVTGQSSSEDWVIDEDTYLRNTSKRVVGDVTVSPNATLTLESSTLQVGGLLHVQSGGTLELLSLGPSSPSRLLSHPSGDGFWMRVDGNMVARGGGAEIKDLWGDGLTATLPGNIGGMKVSGSANLENIHIHDGTAGLFIAKGGSVLLRNSTVENLGEAGITVLGDLRLQETDVSSNGINLVAKDTCDIRIEDSFFAAADQEHILVNGCKAEVHRSALEGGGVGVVANNHAYVLVQDSTIRGYSIDGVASYALQSPSGEALSPILRLHNVTLEPGPHAERGADLEGSLLAEFSNVTISGHSGHGIRAQKATLSVHDSIITGNGGHGIHMIGGRFAVDPLASGNTFMSPDGGNQDGSIRHVALVNFVVVQDQEGIQIPVNGETTVQIHSSDGAPVPLLVDRAIGAGAREVAFEVYATHPGRDEATFLGPFTYQATHQRLAGGETKGELELTQEQVVLTIGSSFLQRLGAISVWLASPLLLVGGGALVFLGLRRSSGKTEDAPGPSLTNWVGDGAVSAEGFSAREPDEEE